MARDINLEIAEADTPNRRNPNSLFCKLNTKQNYYGIQRNTAPSYSGRVPMTQDSPPEGQRPREITGRTPSAERKELLTRILRLYQSRDPVKVSLRNDSKSRWSQIKGRNESFVFTSRPALRELLSKGLSIRRWEKQPGVSRRKEHHRRQRKYNQLCSS